MITFEKQENGVLFTFENSDKYLYGDGTILVPFNSLAVIQDESDMITLRKSASWDIFLSGRYDTDFGYASKEEAVNALKEILYDEAGISEEEVQQMIDAATSGIPSSEVVEQLRRDVNAVSGEVDTKQDILTAGENITISGNVISAEAGNNIIELTQEEYDALTEKDPDALYIITDAQEINMNDYATKTEVDAALSGKADTSAVTAVANDVQTVSGQVATKVETSDFNAFSAATDARIAEDEETTAAALNDLAETVSGKQDTLISGENIKTINNISILGAGNITVSGGGGGDYQYYSEDTTNESATIEVGEQSLSVDGNGVYVNNSPVVTAEDLEDNYYTQQTIDEKEEVIASALTELNLRVTEDEEVTAAALNNLNENKQDALQYYEENTEEGWADMKVTSDDGEGNVDEYSFNVGAGSVDLGHYNQYDDGQGNSGFSNTNILFANPELQLYAESDDNGTTESTYLIVYPTGVTINNERVATEPYVDAALSGKVDTSAITTAITSGSTDAEIPTAKAVYDATQSGGGGATYSAGTNISIDTANTINCTLPITVNTNGSFKFGSYITSNLYNNEFLIGNYITSTAAFTAALGSNLQLSCNGETAIGGYNISRNDGYETGSTIFTVGNGSSNYARHNAFEIRKNGDIYIALNGQDVKLQDQLGGGGGVTVDPTLDSGSTNPVANSAITTAMNAKQDALSAGTGISISNNVISTSGVVMSQTVTQLVKLTQAAYDALVTKDSSTLYIISD